MIVDAGEIEKLKERLDACWGDPYSRHMREQELCLMFVSDNPHLLLPLGFVETRVFGHSPEVLEALAARFYARPDFIKGLGARVAYRREDSEWYLVGRPGWPDDSNLPPVVPFYSENGTTHDFSVQIGVPVEALRVLPNRTLKVNSLTVLPSFPLWVPNAGDSESAIVSLALISSLREGKMSLCEIKPFDLEDVVAQVMKDRGHTVLQTKRTRDGGRDLIVSGEFFPGVEVQMAVEVTSSSKVGVEKVSKALYQNRHFPLLMVVTSGTFSAGVMREQLNSENRLRLHLVDGETLLGWIRAPTLS